MSDNVKVLIVGAGPMAVAYAKALETQNTPFTCVGRSEISARAFYDEVGCEAIHGGVEQFLSMPHQFEQAIVCVPVHNLAEVTLTLIHAGIKRILVEKPAALCSKEISEVELNAKKTGTEVYVAYNRRFYASTIAAEKMICEDGRVDSFCFEFTEWTNQLIEMNIPATQLEYWFFVNSSHVTDLAFFLGGTPKTISCFTKGPQWAFGPSRAYTGAGISDSNALFSYHANWASPGRWGLEVLTSKRRLIFRPMEQLHVQRLNSVSIDKVEIDDQLDKDYKPGLFLQTKAFLTGENAHKIQTINKQAELFGFYHRMREGDAHD